MLGSDAAMTANGPLMAQDDQIAQSRGGLSGMITLLTRDFAVERVTRIELAWPAWKSKPEAFWLGGFLTFKRKG